MSARAKLLTTVATLWVAAVAVLVGYYWSNAEPTRTDRDCSDVGSDFGAIGDCMYDDKVDTAALLLTTGIVTAVALALLVLAVVWTKPSD